MDETIGVKGGHNDYKRMFTITKKQKEKLKKYQEEKELKELEKEVKRKQIYTLIKTLPIVITGATFKELTTKKEKKKEEIKQEKNIVFEDNKKENKPETKKIIIVLKDGTKQVIEVPITQEINEIKEVEKESKVKEEKQENIILPVTEEKQEILVSKEFQDLTEKQKEKLQKLQARKIIDVYEKELKDIRYELRNLVIDYNTLVDEHEKTIQSREEEKLLDRLNYIIKRIEELKEKIRIEDLDKYDDNYIYTLIEEYLNDFKDKKLIKEIKDSQLYILISDKLDEFDRKKDKFKDQVKEKKDELEEKEEDFEVLKEKYFKIDKINKQLEDFYREQELILKEMQDKIDKSTTITEKVEVQVDAMTKQTRRLLNRLALMMFIPGPKGAKAIAAATTMYYHMMNNMINPQTTTKKYKVITVYDYSKDIENNIKKIGEVQEALSKCSKDIDKIISTIKTDFSEYIGVIKECDELLSNLEDIKSNIKEKEYEIDKMKSKQEKELERNNAKVLTKGTYSM